MRLATPKFTIKATRSFAISLIRGIFGVEVTKVLTIKYGSKLVSNLSHPFDARQTVSSYGLVLLIFRMGGLSQIFPTVIKTLSVSVVEFRRRFLPSLKFPDHSMHEKRYAIQTGGLSFSLGIKMTNQLAGKSDIASLPMPVVGEMVQWAFTPPQFPGFRIVTETLAQIFRGWQSTWGHSVLGKGPVVRAAADSTHGGRPHSSNQSDSFNPSFREARAWA
jgi:hypothetical protein